MADETGPFMADETEPFAPNRIRPDPSNTVPVSIGKYLLPSERRRLTIRQLPIPLAVHLAAMIGGLLAAIAVSQLPGIAGAERVVAWILWVFLAARLFAAAASWPNYHIVVTNKRVLVISGIFTREAAPFPLPDADEVGVKQSARGRLIGYGTITLTPAAGTPSSFTFMPYAQQLYLELLSPGEDAEED
jgi:hypothetical protein